MKMMMWVIALVAISGKTISSHNYLRSRYAIFLSPEGLRTAADCPWRVLNQSTFACYGTALAWLSQALQHFTERVADGDLTKGHPCDV